MSPKRRPHSTAVRRSSQFLEAHDAARDRTGRNGRRAREPHLARPGTPREVAIDGTDRYLIRALRNTRPGVDACTATRFNQLDSCSLEDLQHAFAHAVLTHVLTTELQEE